MTTIIRAMFTLALVAFGAVSAAEHEPTDLVQMGAYIASGDLEKSERFYTLLFDSEPIIKLDNFVAFNASGGIFAVAKREVYAPRSLPGRGAIPYIHSTDLKAVQARVQAATRKDAPKIIEEPGIHLLKVLDPNGQLIEFFSLLRE